MRARAASDGALRRPFSFPPPGSNPGSGDWSRWLMEHRAMGGGFGTWLRRGVVAAMLAVPACAGQPPPADDAYCAMLFDQFDAFVFTPQPWGLTFDFRQMQLARIRQARCITFTADLAGMDAAAKSLAGHRPPAGMALQAPVAVAAGRRHQPRGRGARARLLRGRRLPGALGRVGVPRDAHLRPGADAAADRRHRGDRPAGGLRRTVPVALGDVLSPLRLRRRGRRS